MANTDFHVFVSSLFSYADVSCKSLSDRLGDATRNLAVVVKSWPGIFTNRADGMAWFSRLLPRLTADEKALRDLLTLIDIPSQHIHLSHYIDEEGKLALDKLKEDISKALESFNE